MLRLTSRFVLYKEESVGPSIVDIAFWWHAESHYQDAVVIDYFLAKIVDV